jgi:AraC family transcriptional regulator, glycine betaine-responsive activator
MPDMDRTGSDAHPFRIGIFPVRGFALMSYACTVEPLRAANLLARRTLYDVVHFAAGDQAWSSGAASVAAARRIGETPDLDLLLVIAGGDPAGFRDAAALGWLRRIARRGVPLGGVSGGPVILAMAGLMEGRRMTVHWEHAPQLAELAPGVLVERRLYVIDRDRVTCGGGTAPLDLMHALIAEHHGGVFARLVSDWFLHTDIRASADPQRAGLSERLGTSSAPLLDAVAAMEDHVADPLTLPQLATIAGVSPRHLNRLFRDRFGRSTMDYYRGIRLDVAQHLLGSASLSLTDIALATGFAGSAHFSRAFSAQYGMPPSRARR